ncbi:MAG: leucine-rich repeat domain-containing protein [Paludibacteraceae bacterium]|nr:leucine-rich repeat domain-containing protein [Paludibacteraceae bacterium]
MKNEIKQALVAKKTKFLVLMVAFCVTSALRASNTITYTATKDLSDQYYLGVGKTTFGSAITSHTFSNGTGTITCSGEITTIGYEAFYYCTNLTSITIPNSVTTIGNEAFYRCYGLTSITIPNFVTTIGDHAFYYCSGLTSITIPNSVKEIQGRAFASCTGLTSVTIPNSVTTIGEFAFSWCSALTSVTIPNSVTTIGVGVFSTCYGLTSVSIPNSVTTIERMAFHDCSSLTSVNIPNSVTTIEDLAYYACSSLTSVNIPNSVTTIGQSAFCRCTSLTSIDVDAANTHYVSVDGVLFNYAKDTLLQYPARNPRTEYTVPNSVTTIVSEAFYTCSSLTAVTIPNSVTTIEEFAFEGCRALTSITCEATTPPACGRDCFDWVDIYIPLYVPAGSVEAYKAANEWKKFTNILPIGNEPTILENLTIDPKIGNKFIFGNQLYIRRGDKLYNAIGLKVK